MDHNTSLAGFLWTRLNNVFMYQIFCRHLFNVVYDYYTPLWSGMILPGFKLLDMKSWELMSSLSSFSFESWNAERTSYPWSIFFFPWKFLLPTTHSSPLWGRLDFVSVIDNITIFRVPQILIDLDREGNKVFSWTWKKKKNSSTFTIQFCSAVARRSVGGLIQRYNPLYCATLRRRLEEIP